MAGSQNQNLLQTDALKEGKYSPSDLRQLNYLRSGEPLVIGKEGHEKIYLPLGGRSGSHLLDLDTGQRQPAETVITGRITVRKLNQVEMAKVRSLSPDPGKPGYRLGMGRLLPRETFDHKLLKGSSDVKSIAYENYVVAHTTRHVPHGKDSAPAAVYVELSEKIRKRERARGPQIEESQRVLQRTGIVTRDAIREAEEALREKLAGATDVETYRRSVAQLETNHRTVVSAAEQLRHQLNLNTTLDALHRLRTGSSKSYVVQTPEGAATTAARTTGLTRMDIVDSVDELMGKTTEVLREQSIAHRRSDASGVPLRTITSERTKNLLGDSLADLHHNIQEKSLRPLTIEAAADMAMAHGMGNENFRNSAMKEYRRLVKSFDRLAKTSFGRRTDVRHPIIGGMSNFLDARSLAGRGSEPIARTLDAELRDLKDTSSYLLGSFDGEKVDRRGIVHRDATGVHPHHVAQKIFRDTIIQVNQNVGALEQEQLKRYLREINPETRHRRNKFNYNQRVRYGDKFERHLSKRAGLLSVVSSMVGAYFYQSMLHSMARRSNQLLQNFIHPSEIIEAEKHSSTETSVRRLLTSDFGNMWTYIKTFAGIVTDDVGRGLTMAGKRQGLLKRFGEEARQILDPSYRKQVKRDVVARYQQFKREGARELEEVARKSFDEAVDVVSRHKTGIALSTGGVLLLTNLGQSDGDRATEEFLRKRYYRSSQQEHLNYNQAFANAQGASLMPAQGIMTGFSSPFDLLKFANNLILNTVAKLRRIPNISQFSADKMVSKIEGRGFQYVNPKSSLQKQGESLLEFRKQTGRIGASGEDVGHVAAGKLRRDVYRERALIADQSNATVTAGGATISPKAREALQGMWRGTLARGEIKSGLRVNQPGPTNPHNMPRVSFEAQRKPIKKAADTELPMRAARRKMQQRMMMKRAPRSATGDAQTGQELADTATTTLAQQMPSSTAPNDPGRGAPLSIFKGKSSKQMPFEDPKHRSGFEKFEYDRRPVGISSAMGYRESMLKGIGDMQIGSQKANYMYSPIAPTQAIRANPAANLQGIMNQGRQGYTHPHKSKNDIILEQVMNTPKARYPQSLDQTGRISRALKKAKQERSPY